MIGCLFCAHLSDGFCGKNYSDLYLFGYWQILIVYKNTTFKCGYNDDGNFRQVILHKWFGSNRFLSLNLQLMKPVYEGCIEKGTQHVATQATNHMLGTTSLSRQTSSNAAPTSNGKVKRSWGYAQSSDANHNTYNQHDPHRSTSTAPTTTTIIQQHDPSSTQPQLASVKNRKNRRKSMHKKWASRLYLCIRRLYIIYRICTQNTHNNVCL